MNMFQPNGLRALRDLKLDKELEKELEKNQSSRPVSGQKRITSAKRNSDDPSDLSDDNLEESGDGNLPEANMTMGAGFLRQSTMPNNSEYFSKMKSLLEKNPHHPMNFIFDHKDLLLELTEFIKETREWRDQQKEELSKQLHENKLKAVKSVEENSEFQQKLKEQIEFEQYLEKVQSIQDEYTKDMKNYSTYTLDKQKTSQDDTQRQELNHLIDISSKKIADIENIQQYLQKAEMEVEYNQDSQAKQEEREKQYNEDIKKLNIDEKLMDGISDWEKEIDDLLQNLTTGQTYIDPTLTSKQRIQSAKQAMSNGTSKKAEEVKSRQSDDDIFNQLDELDNEFKELEKILESASE